MAMYDVEGDVSYVEGKMSDARKYRQKQAAKQEKFSKRLQMADWAITGANFVINKKADALESDRITERAWYNTALENSKNWRSRYDAYTKENLTNQQMFERDVEENLRAAVQREKGADVNIAGFDNAIRAEAKRWTQGEGRFEAWNKAMKSQLEIPTLTAEQLAERIQKDGAPPRNIASFLGNKLLKVAKSHTDETLNEVEQKEVSNRLNGILGEKFNSVKTAMAEHRAKGNNINEFLDWVRSDEGKKIPTYKSTKAEILEDSDEITGITTQSLITIGEKANGVWEPVGDTAPTVITTTKRKVPAKVYNTTQLQTAITDINEFIRTSNNDSAVEKWEQLTDDKNTAGEAEKILITSNNLQTKYDMDPAKAILVAAEYRLGNEKQFPDTKPNAWNIAQITQEVDDDAFGFYLQDIIESRQGLTRQVETSQLASRLILTIKSNDSYDEDTKAEKILEINKLLKATEDKTGIGIQDDSKIIFNTTSKETVEDTYTQSEIEKGVPQQDTLINNHNNLYNSLLSLNYKLGQADKRRMSGTEYKQAEQKIANNSIKIKQFKEKFNISFDKVLNDLQQEKRNYRKAMSGVASQYSPLSPVEVYKKYDNNTLAEMLAFMNL